MTLGLIVLTGLGAMLDASPVVAAEIMNEITWAHSSPGQVRNFVLYVSPVEGAVESARRINLGKPPSESSGFLAFFSAIVPIDPEDFVAVGAIGHDGRVSGLSAWGQPQPTQPGQPFVVEP